MVTAQMNSPRFSFQETVMPTPRNLAVPAGHTLDEYRVLPGRYAGSFSKRSTWPLWAAGLLVAAVAGTGFGLYENAERNTPQIAPAATITDPSIPATSAASVAAPTAPTATVHPSTAPLSTLSKTEEANSMPMAGQVNNHSSDTMHPANADTNTATKVPVKKVAPKAVAPSPAKVVAPQPVIVPQAELAPLTPPPPIVDEKPPVPAPAPDVPTPAPPAPAPVPAPQ